MRALFTLLTGITAVSAWSELLHTLIMNKNIDAIVKPGAYNSHMHSFFGSDAITNVMPTTTDLQKGCYSGANPNDFSVYWIPTLYHVDNHTFTEVPIFTFGTYYTAAYSEIPIPQDFSMVSGLASAQSQAEADHPENKLGWYCEETPDVYESEKGAMPTKACQQHLRFTLLFPNCVNPGNASEYGFSDSSTNQCPSGMKRMPQLRYSARYDTKSVAPNGWDGTAPFQLSCSNTTGAGYCMHGDFINGWHEDAALDMLVGEGNGRDDGKFISGALGSSAAPATCVPTDQDPENGTSNYLESLEMMESSDANANYTGDSTTKPVEISGEDSITSTTFGESIVTTNFKSHRSARKALL
ncbi:hypothetical protein HJFPF1_02359 [Paramyrothecium foliicola]|nr:hypothetical protein HJFPF1_02359 [Paramyrothecium foliicola]